MSIWSEFKEIYRKALSYEERTDKMILHYDIEKKKIDIYVEEYEGGYDGIDGGSPYYRSWIGSIDNCSIVAFVQLFEMYQYSQYEFNVKDGMKIFFKVKGDRCEIF